MGSSCQKWSSWKTYEAPVEDQKSRKTKAKHLKRLGRTNTVIHQPFTKEELEQKDENVKVRRAHQSTSLNGGIKGIDISALKKAAKEVKIAVPQPYVQKDEPADIELKALTTLDKESASESEMFLLKEAFSRHFLLGNLSLNAIDSILKEMDYFSLEPNKTLFDQGDSGMHLFILTKGVLEVKVNKETVSLISEGNAFGEIALIYSWKRTAQIASKDESCHLWTIHRDSFHKIMKGISDQSSFIRTNIVRELRVFSFIDRDVRTKLSEYMIPMKFSKGDVIIRKGIQEILYIITRGKVKKQSSNNSKIQWNKFYKKGRIIGFSTMMHDTSLHDTYIWETDVDWFNISGDTLRLIFGEGKYFESIVLRLFLEDILEEKRIATNDTARISSLNEEDKHEEDMKHMDDDTSVVGSCAHFLERLTNEELNNLSQLLEIK